MYYLTNDEVKIAIEYIDKYLSDNLTSRETRVIKLRFGLEDGICRNFAYVAKKFNVSNERIRQIEVKVIRRLKNRLSNNFELFEPEYIIESLLVTNKKHYFSDNQIGELLGIKYFSKYLDFLIVLSSLVFEKKLEYKCFDLHTEKVYVDSNISIFTCLDEYYSTEMDEYLIASSDEYFIKRDKYSWSVIDIYETKETIKIVFSNNPLGQNSLDMIKKAVALIVENANFILKRDKCTNQNSDVIEIEYPNEEETKKENVSATYCLNLIKKLKELLVEFAKSRPRRYVELNTFEPVIFDKDKISTIKFEMGIITPKEYGLIFGIDENSKIDVLHLKKRLQEELHNSNVETISDILELKIEELANIVSDLKCDIQVLYQALEKYGFEVKGDIAKYYDPENYEDYSEDD